MIVTNIAGGPTGATSALVCPIGWSQDATSYPLLEVYATVMWSGVPTTSSFDPGCSIAINASRTDLAGIFHVTYDHTDGSGTSVPTLVYHWKAASPAAAPFTYGSVVGAYLSCLNVPQGVVLNGYSMTTCIATATSSGSF